MTSAAPNPHPLACVFHPKWCPADDIELLRLRDAGRPLDRIAQALLRDPGEVELRWHRLRVVPGIRERLKAVEKPKAPYPGPGEWWR